MVRKREHFGSRMAAVLALAGSAVGLGNIWRFPYMVGEYGGAAYILVYLICSFFIALPIFFSETIIGRRGGYGAQCSFENLAPGTNWKWIGSICVLACFIIVSYYSVVGGWPVDYFVRSVVTGFHSQSLEEATSLFGKVTSSLWEPVLFHTVFIGLTALIVVLGIRNGIEKFTKFTMPVLFILIVVIMVYSITLPGSLKGVEYLVKPDFSKLTPNAIAYALGQSFFSMSLGVGCVITYASYMSKNDNLFSSGVMTSFFDFAFAIIASFAVIPAVFAAGLEPGAGPSLVFETLPFIFAKMGANSPWISRIVTIFFFLAILFAALTSAISMFEVCVTHFVDKKGISRKKASIIFFASAWALGVVAAVSPGAFSFFDTLASNYLMTLGAFATAVFVGWKMSREEVRMEFTNNGTIKLNCVIFDTFHFIIRYIIPEMILIIFVTNFIL